MNMSKNQELWHQLSCVDDGNLSGESIKAFLELIESIVKIKDIWIDDAIGAFESERFPDGKSFQISELKSELKSVIQFDWGFLFINNRQDKRKEQCEEDKLLNDFESSEIAVRLVDDSYFYVYSKNRDYIDAISKVVNQANVKTSCFEDLDIPY